MKRLLIGLILFVSGSVYAHEMTPAYVNFRTSLFDGILETELNMFNRRADVEYYEIEVFDYNWDPLPFATDQDVFRLKYLDRKKIPVYIRKRDRNRVAYICTTSKLFRSNTTSTVVASKICSKVLNRNSP